MNESQKKKGYKDQYSLPNVFDYTPCDNLPRLDEYVIDHHIVDFIGKIYEKDINSSWAKRNPDKASIYFTGPPYCEIAQKTLGYQSDTVFNPYVTPKKK